MKKLITRFLVLGAGAWGSALALHLARQEHEVVLWGHDPEEINDLIRTRSNERYLPGELFPPKVAFFNDLTAAFSLVGNEAVLLIAVPSFAFENTLKQIQSLLPIDMPILWATKGLSEDAQLLEVICEKYAPKRSLAVLSGPSFAKEVAQGLPTAITIATHSSAFGGQLVQAFHSEYFRVYLSDDLVGVQLGGVVKNVLAIAVGMSDGLGYGANARAALITRGLAELCRLAEKMGAKHTTLMGLSGVGDMVLTCTDNQSRNRRFGLALGQGFSPEQAQTAIAQVVEGSINVKQIMLLSEKYKIEMPICQQVYAVLYESIAPKQAVKNLLTRPPKLENIG